METRKLLSIISILLLLTISLPPAMSQGRVGGQVIMQRGLDVGTGQIFFVDDSGSDEGASNGSINSPWATLDYAVGRCGTSPAAASTGCTIYAMPGHAETFSGDNSLVIDVAGISMIGLGKGNLRPQITLATSTAAQVGIAAANVEFANFYITNNIANNVAWMTISAAGDGAWVHHNIFEDGSASGLLMIDIEGIANDVVIEHNRFYADTGTGDDDAAIDFGAAVLRLTIRHNSFFGEYDLGTIFNSTGAALDIDIYDNYIQNEVAGAEAIDLNGASLGIIRDNILATDDYATALDPGSAGTSGNVWLSNVVDGSDAIPIGGGLGATPKAPVRFGGNTFWVNSSGGSDATGSGRSADNPFATLDFAFGSTSGVTANNGDVIYVMENHAETLNASGGNDIDMDLAGVSVVGLGTGLNRPTFTYATETNAEIVIGAADIYIENILLVCNIDSSVAMIHIESGGDGLHLNNIEIREGSGTPVLMIDMVGQADDVIIENSTFLCPTAANCTSAISLSALTPARLTVRNNFIRGDWNTGALEGSGAGTDYNIHDNQFTNLLTGVVAVEFGSTALGSFRNNVVSTDLILTALNPGSLGTSGNFWTSAVGTDNAATPIPEYNTWIPGYGYRVVKASMDSSVDPDNMFSVTGLILITLLIGEVLGVLSSTHTMVIESDTDVIIAASTTVSDAADGVLLLVCGDKDIALNGADTPTLDATSVGACNHGPIIFGGIGATTIIRNDPSASETGTSTWLMYYIPLSPGATVVAN